MKFNQLTPAMIRLMAPADRVALNLTPPFEEPEEVLQEFVASLLSASAVTYCRPAMHAKTTIRKGWPDFTFAVAGIPFAIECKRHGSALSKAQAEVRAGLLRDGWRYFIVHDQSEALGVLRTCGVTS